MTESRWTLKKDVFQRFPSGIWLMMGLDTFINIAFSVALPFFALYLHNERNFSMSLVGTIFLCGGLVSGTTSIIGGMLSDRFGRRRLILSIAGVSIFAYALLAGLIGYAAPTWVIVLVYILSRGITGIINPTISAIVADLSPGNRLAESYALVRVGANVGFAIGPAAGGFLITFLSYAWVLSLSSLMYLLITVLIFFFLRESFTGSKGRVDLRSTLAVASDHPFLVFVIFSILLGLSIAHLGSTLSVFSVNNLGFSTAQYGLMLTANGLIVMVFQYPVTYLVNKLPKAGGLVLGSLLYVIGYASMGWVTGYNWALVSIVVITAGEVTYAPISSSVVAESAPPDKRGRYMGFFALSQTLGNSLTPLFGGVLLDTFSGQPRLLWGIIGSVGVVAALGFYLWGKMTRKTPGYEAGNAV
jgi:MFS family permease